MDGNSREEPFGWEFKEFSQCMGDPQMLVPGTLKGGDPQMVIQGRNPEDGM